MDENKNNNNEIYSQRVRAGKRTYFFDVRATRAGDHYLTITESKKKFKDDDDGFYFEKHKLFLYKEDFDKFSTALQETLDHIRTELQPHEEDNTVVESPSASDSDLSWE